MNDKNNLDIHIERYNKLKFNFERISLENVNYLDMRTELITEFVICEKLFREISDNNTTYNNFNFYIELKKLEEIIAKGFYYRKRLGIDDFIDIDYNTSEDKNGDQEKSLVFTLPKAKEKYSKRKNGK